MGRMRWECADKRARAACDSVSRRRRAGNIEPKTALWRRRGEVGRGGGAAAGGGWDRPGAGGLGRVDGIYGLNGAAWAVEGGGSRRVQNALRSAARARVARSLSQEMLSVE